MSFYAILNYHVLPNTYIIRKLILMGWGFILQALI
jgi:hypothetical protein